MAQLDNPSSDIVLSALTEPLVAENISTPQGRKNLIYVVGSADIVYALDEASGAVVWQKKFPNTLKPRQNASVSCPNTQKATPVIDKAAGIIYVLTSDGKLRGLSLTDGSDRMPPTDFVTPFVRDWSLNLIDGVIFTTFRPRLRRGVGRCCNSGSRTGFDRRERSSSSKEKVQHQHGPAERRVGPRRHDAWVAGHLCDDGGWGDRSLAATCSASLS